MIYSFDLLNEIFEWCLNDDEMCNLLGIDKEADNLLDVANNKLRREYQTDVNVVPEDVHLFHFILCTQKS